MKASTVKSDVNTIFNDLAETVSLRHITSKTKNAYGDTTDYEYNEHNIESVIAERSITLAFEDEGDVKTNELRAYFKAEDDDKISQFDRIISDGVEYEIRDISNYPKIQGETVFIHCSLKKK